MEPINTSNEECLLGGQTLALSDSENENYKDEHSSILTSTEIVANCTENDDSTSKDINPIIGDEDNSKYETTESESLLLNDQINFNSDDHTDDIHLRKINNEFDDQATKMKNDSTSSQVVEITTNYLGNSLTYNSDSDRENKICTKKSKRIEYSDDEDIIEKIDVNQESENKISVNADINVQKNKKISTIIDSESEEEFYPNAEENNEKKLLAKYNENTSNSEIQQIHKKISAIIDSESDEEELLTNDDEKFNSEEYANIQTGYDKIPRQQRASAKIALDTISAIKSETQRMHRENQINVPYHKPRNCTLKEFMARKSQDVLTKTIGKGLSLKMSEEELENYVKYLEKREQESQELFANESIIPEFRPTIKEDKEENECADIINNDSGQNDIINTDNVQSEVGESSKITIISNIVIKSPIITPEPSVIPTLNISNLRKLISEDKYQISSPTLQGDSKFVIDLESGDMIPSTLDLTPKSGVDKLFERFLKSSGCKKRNNSTTTSPIISDNNESTNLLNGNDSLIDESKLNNTKDRKPGASYVSLKNNLRKIIFESRKIVLDKKINDFKIENKMVEQICAEEDEEDDYVSECDEENQDIEKDNYKVDENSDDENTDEEVINETEDIIENEEIEDADDESDDSTNNENIRNKKLSHRVIKRFEDDSDDSQEYNFLNMSAKESNKIEINEKQEEELLELCSGKFDLTQQQSETAVTGFVIPTTQLATQFNESQLEALCSGIFTDKVTESVNIGIVSDEEELFKKPHEHNTKTTANKIVYSDDDEEKNNIITNFEANTNTKYSNDDDENEEEQIETFIDYDSDENEIHVEMTKNDRKMKANDFVEKEAELSDSEWGSADEDEKDLDRYDIELGDEDQFDQEKLQSELGKIHMRKMLDEDAREVKKIQELLLEDEENDGLGRQRQFRWRKTENGFDINDDNQENKGSGGEDDDESEEQWRKMKHEREMLLMEIQTNEQNKIIRNGTKLNSSNEIGETISSPKFSISKLKKKCIDLNKKEIDSPFLISKNNSVGIRGSFLKRDQEILSKVAANLISSKEMNNNIDSDSNDNIGRVKTTTGKYKNFVFTILSQPPQPQQTNKRKLSDISDIDTNKLIKKSKFIPHQKKKNLIDHLDLTEI